jgi:AcrR family transcriptional regulator
MAATIGLIAEKGFERTTAAEIGARAGYSRNMVRDRYGSKDALLEALCEQEFADRLLPAASRERRGTGLELVLGQLDDLIGAVREAPEEFAAIVVLAFEAPGPIASLRSWWAAMIERYEATMIEHLQAGRADGSIRAELDAEREAEIFVSYGAGLCYRWGLLRREFDFSGELEAWRGRLEAQYAARR